MLRQRQRVLTEAASAVLASVLPGQQQARRSDMDALLGADSEALTGLPPSTRIACMAAVVWARLHSGQHSSALAFIEKRVLAGLRNVAAEMTPSTQSTCYSIIAECYLLNGYLAEGLHCAEQAFDYAIEARDIGCEFRALSLRSLGFSLNGEIAQAEPLAEAASALSAERGWVAGSSFCSLSSALILIGARRTDGEALRRIVAERADYCCDPLERTITRLGHVIDLLLRAEFEQTVASARALTHSADATACSPFILDLAAGVEGMALIHLGEPARALSLVGRRRPLPGHAQCLAGVRASAHLLQGDARAALRATDECVNPSTEHSVGSLPGVLLRRALAHDLLGNRAAADADFSKAMHLAHTVGAVTPALGVSRSRVKGLLERLAVNEVEFHRVVVDHLPRSVTLTDIEPSGPSRVRLTEREAVVARRLASGLTFPAIAAELQLSVNTVKSQSRSIYRKLNVSSRWDAVAQLEQSGFYDEAELAV